MATNKKTLRRKPKEPSGGSKWQVAEMRVHAFCSISPVELSQKWYEEITEEKPTESVSRRIERIDKGNSNGVELMVFADLIRVIIGISPHKLEEMVDIPLEMPSIGTFDECRGLLERYVGRWLVGAHPPITRLAVNARLIQPVKDIKEGYRLLTEYLPAVQIDTENSSDFMYRVSRPQRSKSGVPGLLINKLSTWAVMQAAVRATVTVGAPRTGQDHALMNIISSLVELDINTSQDYSGSLPDGKLPKLTTELFDVAADIARKGDVK